VPQLGTGHPVDDRIDEVLAEAMNKDPERRPPSAADMRASLLAIIRDLDAARVPTLPAPDAVLTPPPRPPTEPGGGLEPVGSAADPSDAPAGVAPWQRRWAPVARLAAARLRPRR
jgi:hypothetical protein